MQKKSSSVLITAKSHQELLREKNSLEEKLKDTQFELGELIDDESCLVHSSAREDARNTVYILNGQIADIDELLALATIVPEGIKTDCVCVGTVFDLEQCSIDGVKTVKRYIMDGMVYTRPDVKVISVHSPIGSAILGAKVGQQVTCHLPKGEVQLQVLEILAVEPANETDISRMPQMASVVG